MLDTIVTVLLELPNGHNSGLFSRGQQNDNLRLPLQQSVITWTDHQDYRRCLLWSSLHVELKAHANAFASSSDWHIRNI